MLECQKCWSVGNVGVLEMLECDGKGIKMLKHRNMEM